MMLENVLIAASFSVMVSIGGCTSKQEEPTEPVKADAAVDEGDAAMPEEAAAPEEVATPPAEVASPPAEVASPPAEVAAPPMPMGSRKVFFAKSDAVDVHEQADLKSKVLNKLNKGDPIAGEVQGNWIALSGGGFVNTKSVTTKGKGRQRGTGTWQ